MSKRINLIVIFLLIFHIQFVFSANYPAPYISSSPTGQNILSTHTPSQEEKNCNGNGCFFDNHCYQYGYRKDNEYCADEFIVRFSNGGERYTEKDVFINQSEDGKNCVQNYECKTNLCLNKICTNLNEEINNRVVIEVEKTRQTEIANIEKDVEYINNYENTSLSNSKETAPEEKNIFELIFNWFGRIFG